MRRFGRFGYKIGLAVLGIWQSFLRNGSFYSCDQCNIFLSPTGVTHRHLSDHMSDMVENTLNDLQQSKV